MSTENRKKKKFFRSREDKTRDGRIPSPPLADRQQEAPSAYCRRCRAELYRWDGGLFVEGGPLCHGCHQGNNESEDTEEKMTLYEMSKEYRAQAAALHGRIRQLRAQGRGQAGDTAQLEARICMLSTMWREARDLAVLTERYYERGYRRNGRYTL